jgi:hypothetical protein
MKLFIEFFGFTYIYINIPWRERIKKKSASFNPKGQKAKVLEAFQAPKKVFEKN